MVNIPVRCTCTGFFRGGFYKYNRSYGASGQRYSVREQVSACFYP
jgi:hypothetical protein